MSGHSGSWGDPRAVRGSGSVKSTPSTQTAHRPHKQPVSVCYRSCNTKAQEAEGAARPSPLCHMDSQSTRLLLTGCVCSTDRGMDNRERGNVITLQRINHFNGSVTEITARQWHSLLINLLLCSRLLPPHHLHLTLPGKEMPSVGTTLASGFWLSRSSRSSR